MARVESKVNLIAHTQNPLAVIYSACKQCYSKEYVAEIWPKLRAGTISREEQGKLVKKVVATGHDSTVEHVSFTFSVAGISRAASHQLVRHRIASYSQQSQRYTDSKDIDYIMPLNIKKIPNAAEYFKQFMATVSEAYEYLQAELVANGYEKTANEDARFVLPNACETMIVVTMNCRALLNFFKLRCCRRAQWEIRAVAEQMLMLCKQELPEVFRCAGAPCEATGVCPESEKFSCGKYPTIKS